MPRTLEFGTKLSTSQRYPLGFTYPPISWRWPATAATLPATESEAAGAGGAALNSSSGDKPAQRSPASFDSPSPSPMPGSTSLCHAFFTSNVGSPLSSPSSLPASLPRGCESLPTLLSESPPCSSSASAFFLFKRASLFLNFKPIAFLVANNTSRLHKAYVVSSRRTFSNVSKKSGFQRKYCSRTQAGTHSDSTGSASISINAMVQPYFHERPRFRSFTKNSRAPPSAARRHLSSCRRAPSKACTKSRVPR